MQNQVFISYRHENATHAAAVRRLGLLLRQATVPVVLDQFYLEDNPGGPDVGWPRWCEECAVKSRCVLVIASEGWFAAYNNTDQAQSGRGAATEAALFQQDLWDKKGDNDRIRLAFLHPITADKVPVRLRAWHQFKPFETRQQLDQLIRWITACLGLQGVEPPTVTWPQPIEFQPGIADRNKSEWPAIVDLLAGNSRERILLIQGASGVGKSELIRHAKTYAKKLGIPVAHVDFRGGILDTNDVLGALSLDLADFLPNFSQEGSSRTHLLRRDLRALQQSVLLIFDTYEAVSDNTRLADWLSQQLLTEVETSLGLGIILAGQKVPNTANAGWQDLARHLLLEPIREFEAWENWISQRYPDFKNKGDLLTLLIATDGSPLLMATYCARVAAGVTAKWAQSTD